MWFLAIDGLGKAYEASLQWSPGHLGDEHVYSEHQHDVVDEDDPKVVDRVPREPAELHAAIFVHKERDEAEDATELQDGLVRLQSLERTTDLLHGAVATEGPAPGVIRTRPLFLSSLSLLSSPCFMGWGTRKLPHD